MSDLISRADTVDYVREWQAKGRNCVDAVYEVPTANEWIPVTRELPALEEDVLVCTKDYGRGSEIFVAWREGKLHPEWNSFSSRLEDGDGGIIAWMPLPEVYREGQV